MHLNSFLSFFVFILTVLSREEKSKFSHQDNIFTNSLPSMVFIVVRRKCIVLVGAEYGGLNVASIKK